MMTLKKLERISYAEIDKIEKGELDGYIARHVYHYRSLERSLLGGYYTGYWPESGEIGRYPAPECSSNANATFAALKSMQKKFPIGNIFIEWWQTGEWYVCNRPISDRGSDMLEANCDGRLTGSSDIKLAVTRFMVKFIKSLLEVEPDDNY